MNNLYSWSKYARLSRHLTDRLTEENDPNKADELIKLRDDVRKKMGEAVESFFAAPLEEHLTNHA